MNRLLPLLLLLAGSLPAQSLQLAVDLRSGATVFQEDRGQILAGTLPAGSLLKVFLAYLVQAEGLKPEQTVFCPPSPPSLPVRDGCWFRTGHRNQDLVQALANSCDHYFMTVAERVPIDAFVAFLDSLDLAVQIADTDHNHEYTARETMVGLNPHWRFPPLKLLAAMSWLVNGRSVPGREAGHFDLPVLDKKFSDRVGQGLREAALYGTAMGFQNGLPFKVSGKTGTFVRVTPKLERDKLSGIFVGFFPYPNPEYGVLVFNAAGNGREQAGVANALVQRLIGAEKIRLRR
jgi:cell division protein FtsI/penicillin-binding protein 2